MPRRGRMSENKMKLLSRRHLKLEKVAIKSSVGYNSKHPQHMAGQKLGHHEDEAVF